MFLIIKFVYFLIIFTQWRIRVLQTHVYLAVHAERHPVSIKPVIVLAVMQATLVKYVSQNE